MLDKKALEVLSVLCSKAQKPNYLRTNIEKKFVINYFLKVFCYQGLGEFFYKSIIVFSSKIH